MLKVYVDADSCPVKDEVIRVAKRHDLEVFMVSNSYLRLNAGAKVQMIVVKAKFDEADNWIAERIEENDIAITSDILLADKCCKKNASVIGPNGKVFSSDNIGMKVAMRDLNSHLRDTGEISSHNASFTKQDRSRFLETLENTIQRIRRKDS